MSLSTNTARASLAKTSLPAHLSYKSALVLLPTDISLTAPIQSVRQAHDRHYQRWPPHINLLYPFLERPSSQIPIIRQGLRNALKGMTPTQIKLDRIDQFVHSAQSVTLCLATGSSPVSVLAAAGTEGVNEVDVSIEAFEQSADDWVKSLHARLKHEFGAYGDGRAEYVPHLSLGQASGASPARELAGKIEGIMKDGCSSEDESEWALNWLVDRVTVLERKGYSDPFAVVLEQTFAVEK